MTRALVYGWSLGGHIGIELMKSHPAVAGMMLTGTPPVSPGPLGVLRGFHANWDLLLASKRNYTARDAERFLHLCFGESAVPAFLDDNSSRRWARARQRVEEHDARRRPRSTQRGGKCCYSHRARQRRQRSIRPAELFERPVLPVPVGSPLPMSSKGPGMRRFGRPRTSLIRSFTAL